jgi:hypothetical protein
MNEGEYLSKRYGPTKRKMHTNGKAKLLMVLLKPNLLNAKKEMNAAGTTAVCFVRRLNPTKSHIPRTELLRKASTERIRKEARTASDWLHIADSKTTQGLKTYNDVKTSAALALKVFLVKK